ncbi:MAG: DUF4493 domain-containing protein [Prevotella sp.]|nr:DUF4493 domain-containing protein [Bacteroides sp.]MCM1366717.1 DUF4493 domain-containing protein [Prevotella sp.]MCM1437269.1 DUF4493 domain-containing protein [Prevotella sp.]
MKSIYKLLLGLLPIFALASCSQDNPFGNGEYDGPVGKLSTKSLLIEYQNDENVVRPSSPAKLKKYVGNVDKADFDIAFIKNGAEEPTLTYKYSEMPEIVTLPVGKWSVRASYGENQIAGFEAPYFAGEKEFEIKENEITDNIGTVTAKFANVRVTILFDTPLISHMSDDSKVTVKVGDKGILEFTKDTQDRSGYFAYVEDSHTLAAEFSGKIDGADDSRVVTFSDVQPGNHYRITFKLATIESEEKGDAQGGLTVDGTIERTDMNVNIDTDWEAIEDDRNNTDPEPVNPPDNPDTPKVKGPQVKVASGCSISLDKVNEVDASSIVALDVTSNTGFTKFQILIDDEDLKSLLMESFGSDSFDLVNPPTEAALDAIHSLNLMPDEKSSVKGEKSHHVDVSQFMFMLCSLGSGKDYIFILELGDSEGENTTYLKLRTK